MIKRYVFPTNPSIANATNATLLAAKADRSYLFIRNYTAGDILIGMKGQTLTALTQSAANPGLTLKTLEWVELSDETVPFTAITVWQASGGATELIHVVEA